MTSAVYSVSVTSLYGTNGPDPSQIYGVLHSDNTTVNWPATLTSISILNAGAITSISAIPRSLYNTSGIFTATLDVGELHSGAGVVPWPAAAQGVVAGSISAGSATAASTPTTPTPSATSGKTTAATPDTKSGTSKVPTSTSNTSPPVSSHSTGISSGATAGIAIGCALVGLAIGLLVAFCLFRRKGKRNDLVSNGALPREIETYPSDKGTPVDDIQLNQFLLEATPDRDIAQETQSIGALIDQHVESYYHSHPVTVDTRALASVLTQLGFPLTTNSASLDARGVAALCLDPRSRPVGLRHVLMRVLFSSIDMHSSHGPSMLPAPAASFLRAIPPAENDRYGDPQGKHSRPARPPPFTTTSLPGTKKKHVRFSR